MQELMQFYQVNYIFFRNFAFNKTYSSSDHYVRFSSAKEYKLDKNFT